MREMTASFSEISAESKVAGIPLSHLSVEVGHLYMDDYMAGPERLRLQFAGVREWVDAVITVHSRGQKKFRHSTCLLIDDYFTQFGSPAEVIPTLLEASNDSGVRIDYILREAGCARANNVPIAQLVEARLIPDPAPGTTGSRPPTSVTGWLSNGQRSVTSSTAQAMGGVPQWAPPVENGARNHSVFVDIELWDQPEGERRWSCAFLASVWQLLRLGMLRFDGLPVIEAMNYEPQSLPEIWAELSPLLQINPKARPFSAFRSVSILGSRFLAIEHAVRTIVGQLGIDREVLAYIAQRAEAESIELPDQLVDRIGYVFIAEPR